MMRLPGIVVIETARKAEREKAIADVAAMQAACEHTHVVAESNWGGRRICACCGIEEAARYSWPTTTIDGGYYEFIRPAGLPTILNTDFFKIGRVLDYRVHI
jgi:hypothetical protein